MIYYVNIDKKRIVGRNNQTSTIPLIMDYSTVESVQFQFINSNNQIQHIEDLSGLYFAASTKMGEQSYNLLFLSKEYTIENDILTFAVDTYTVPYLNAIKKKNTEVNIEIGQVSIDVKKVLLRDYGIANPRVYVAGLTPSQIDSHDYYTIEETNEAIETAIEGIGISGYVTTEQFNEGMELKQDLIDDENKLPYSLISGAPSIPSKVSELENDEGFVNDEYVEQAISGKVDREELADYQPLIDSENKLSYSLLSSTPTIPSKTSDLTNDSDFQTGTEVADAIETATSGLATNAALTAHTSDSVIHVTSTDKQNWNDKLDASALEGYATENYVDSAVSGKQDVIDSDNKLAYSLLSGTPTIPSKTSDLTNDSNFATSAYVDSQTSGKMDTPSGGTVGQVLTKTADGEEWQDPQGGEGGNPTNVTLEDKTVATPNIFVVDFAGKQIQKYAIEDAVAGSLEIQIANDGAGLSGCAPTVELQIPVSGDVSTITLPSTVQVIEMPEVLSSEYEKTGDVVKMTYHDIVFRNQKDFAGIWKTYANYAYKFNEVGSVGPTPPSPIPTSGLTYYMPFNSSTTVPTIGNNLTVGGTGSAPSITTVDGIDCIEIPANTYLYEIGTADYWTYDNDVPNATISEWVYIPTTNSNRNRLIGLGEYGGTYTSTSMGMEFNRDSDNAYSMDIYSAGKVTTSSTKGAWHHMATVIDGINHTFYFYFDGVMINTMSSTNTTLMKDKSIFLNVGYGSTFEDKGGPFNLAAVRIYDRVLDATEIVLLASEFTPVNS